MKRAVICVSLILLLALFNWSVVQKEKTLANGVTMLLKLAPRDPRSLIQGDYMVLRYDVARTVSQEQLQAKGRIVVSIDTNGVANFVRVHTGNTLADGEHLLVYRNRKGLRLGAESFLFQEGDADLYANARYGELRVDAAGNSVLVGLRGEGFEKLGAPPHDVTLDGPLKSE